MYELSLFSGAGGGLLATQHLLGFRTVCYVENGEYPVQVLRARIRDGYLDDAPIWDDVRTFDGRPWRGVVDCVTAGFLCQPFSQAGKRLGEQDERNLWPATARIIREVRSQYVFLENVPTLRCPIRGRQSYFGRVLGDLAESGYDVRWDCIPASAIGANHQRDRLWVVGQLAYTNESGFQEYTQFDGETQSDTTIGNSRGGYVGRCGDEVADADDERHPAYQPGQPREIRGRSYAIASGWWETEPEVGRVVDGLAQRVGQIATLGEGQVPAVVKVVWGLLGG